MNLRELYSGDLFQEAFSRLLEMKVHSDSSEPQRLITQIEGPEVLTDDLLLNWLALNYMCVVDFKTDGRPIMGEIGGIIPAHPQTKKHILGVAEASLTKVTYGAEKVKEAEETSDTRIISRLEAEIGMPLEQRGNITVVNGNKNVANYDFTSGVARENLLELISTSTYLLLASDGFNVISKKCLGYEQYVFNIPVNDELFDGLRSVDSEDIKGVLNLLRTKKDILVPSDFIAGFHITYGQNGVKLKPVIANKDLNANLGWLEQKGLKPSESNIAYLGTSDAYGRFGIMEKNLLD